MDDVDLLRAGFALVFVLGLIALITWVARRLHVGGVLGGSGGVQRVRVVEATIIDSRHKVVLIRRDDVEHLLLLGPSSLILETAPAALSKGAPGPESEASA